VLVLEEGRLVALGPDGSARWTRPVPAQDLVQANDVVYDARQERL